MTKEEIKKDKPSGGERLFLHKLRWSRTALKFAKLVTDPAKGEYKITKRGLKVLKNKPVAITDTFLLQFPEYTKWRRKKNKKRNKSQIKNYFSKKFVSKSISKENFEKEFKKIETDAIKKSKTLSSIEIQKLLQNFSTKSKSNVKKTVKSFVSERDPKLAALMKAKNHHTCQLCQKPTFEAKDGNFYTESHHIIPRAKTGPDVPENILIVCPTCHRIFDSGSTKAQLKAYVKIKSKKLFSNFDKLLQTKTITKKMFNEIIKS